MSTKSFIYNLNKCMYIVTALGKGHNQSFQGPLGIGSELTDIRRFQMPLSPIPGVKADANRGQMTHRVSVHIQLTVSTMGS